MLTKRAKTLFCASVFCVAQPATISWAQSEEMRCGEQETLIEGFQNCDDSARKRMLEVDPSVTNSVNSNNSAGVSNNNGSNDTNASSDNTPSGGDDGSDADDTGDHDNGHGNDPDHDDSSNPGQGGGNHGTGDNGNGRD